MDLSLDCCHLERRESCLQHQPGTAFALMKHNITWNCSVPKGQRFQSPEKPSSEPAQAGCWSAAGNASLIPLHHHPWATLLFPLRASSLRQEGLLSDGITPTHSLPHHSTHPPGVGFCISAQPSPCRSSQNCSSWKYVCTTGCLGVRTCQDFREPFQMQPASSTGHPPAELLGWGIPKGRG